MPLPRVAMTLGDVAGIGPEVTVRALNDPRVYEECCPLVVGCPIVLERAARLAGLDIEILSLPSLDAWTELTKAAERGRHGVRPRVLCWNPSKADAATARPCEISALAGAAACDWLVAATQAALAGHLDAIVTAPLNKAALHLAGHHYPGHTEILAEQCGVRDFAMMLYLPPGRIVRGPHGLGVAHVTLHTSIRSVPDLLNTPAIREKIHLVNRFLNRLDCEQPRIGVCALNPHAGEQGLFGDEEARLIAPAVADAVREGVRATGPLPADTLLQRAAQGEFDGVVAMYHDQGHIALKLIGFHHAINVTLGLPIVRTSPSHGTAFDIAWQGLARADGMLEAIHVACQLARTQSPG